MGTKFWEVACEEHGIGGSGEYCGDNESHFDRINVLHHEALGGKYVPRAVLYEALGGKYVPRAVLFDLEAGVIGAVTLSRRLASSSARSTFCTIRAGNNWARGHFKGLSTNHAETPCSVAVL
jgi:tubulin beta